MGRKSNLVPTPTFGDRFRELLERQLQTRFETLRPEDLATIRPEAAVLAQSLGFSGDEDTGIMLFTSSPGFVVTTVREKHTHTSLAILKSAIELSFLREPRIAGQIQGGVSKADFDRTSDQRIELSASRCSYLASGGDVYRASHEELLKGVEGEPGIPLEDLARMFGKLRLFPEVKARVGTKRAIAAMKAMTFRQFKAFRFTDDPDIKVPLPTRAHKRAGQPETTRKSVQGGRVVVQPPEPQTPLECELRRSVQNNYPVYLANSRHPQVIAGLADSIQAWRDSVNEETRRLYAQSPALGLATSFPLNDDLLTCRNGLELEDRVRVAFRDIGADRRTVAVGVARLADEPDFRSYWNPGNARFSTWARFTLGIGEELRDLLRVGRNLIKYPFFLEGQAGFDSDNAFYSLRFIAQAMITHNNNVELIRARLRTLTTREFAQFASDPLFDKRGSSRPLTRKQVERYSELRAELQHLLDQGHTVRVIELYTAPEKNNVMAILSELEKAVEAQTASAAIELSSADSEVPVMGAEDKQAESTLTLAATAQSETTPEATMEDANNMAA
jgi:hypothetical protein